MEGAGVFIATRESISCLVLLTRPTLNREDIPKQFADPSVLWNSGEALVEQVFEAAMMCSDPESARQKRYGRQ